MAQNEQRLPEARQCLDEKPITLHADVRPASPAMPDREARRDNEYERCGAACPVGDSIKQAASHDSSTKAAAFRVGG
jgi:hypothetical protein